MTPITAHMTELGSAGSSPTTPLDHLARSLRDRASDAQRPDFPRRYPLDRPQGRMASAPLTGGSSNRIPELLVTGRIPSRPTARAQRSGLRCVVDRNSLDKPDALPPGVRPPIIYLPGVERGQLRAGEDCPDDLKPLVELMYRGALWHHPNGRDAWSVTAFLDIVQQGQPSRSQPTKLPLRR